MAEGVMVDGDVESPAGDQVMYLVDPAWVPTADQPGLESSNVIGAWVVNADGSTGAFEANPDHVPCDPGSPTDPVDALLQHLATGDDDATELLGPVLAEARLQIAVDDDGAALLRPAPDGSPAVLVTTAAAHRARVEAPGWRDVTAAGLAAALPGTGVDVLLNPGAPASMLVLASALRDATS